MLSHGPMMSHSELGQINAIMFSNTIHWVCWKVIFDRSVMSIMVSIKADLGIRLALMLAGQSFANRDCGIVELHQVILVLKLELKLL